MTANPETDHAGRHLADRAGERGQAGLDLAVADERAEEGQGRQPDDRRLTQDREVGAGDGVVRRPLRESLHVAQRPEQQEDRHQHAQAVGREDGREGRRVGDVGIEAADHAADTDAEVDQREVDAEVLLAGLAGRHRRHQRVEGRP
ncbi:hypothetical protein LP418_12820 [Nocardioides sp. B-3]|nr:hypothetical protein [Nocardioides sp. B-3]UUZ61375.1 hypothetical protein LP418_12820 [Nocardioides sp. B-3]